VQPPWPQQLGREGKGARATSSKANPTRDPRGWRREHPPPEARPQGRVTTQLQPCKGTRCRHPAPHAKRLHRRHVLLCSQHLSLGSKPARPRALAEPHAVPGVSVHGLCSRGAARGTGTRCPGNKGLSGAAAPYRSRCSQQRNEACVESRAGSRSHQPSAVLPRAASAPTHKQGWQAWHGPGPGLGTARPPPRLLLGWDRGGSGGAEHSKEEKHSSSGRSSRGPRQDAATPETSITPPTVILLARFSASTQSCRSF